MPSLPWPRARSGSAFQKGRPRPALNSMRGLSFAALYLNPGKKTSGKNRQTQGRGVVSVLLWDSREFRIYPRNPPRVLRLTQPQPEAAHSSAPEFLLHKRCRKEIWFVEDGGRGATVCDHREDR